MGSSLYSDIHKPKTGLAIVLPPNQTQPQYSYPSPSPSPYPYPQFFHTDPACSTFISAAMNINGSITTRHSLPFKSSSSTAAASNSSSTVPDSTSKLSRNPAFPSSSSSFPPSPSSCTPLMMNPSRKRSLDDYTSVFDDQIHDSGIGSSTTTSSASTAVDEYQSGSWYENNSSQQPPNHRSLNSSRPCLPSRKSQRLDISATATATMQTELHSSPQSSPSTTTANINNPIQNGYTPRLLNRQTSSSSLHPAHTNHPNHHEEPTLDLDPITHLLGISWQRVTRTDSDVAAALRGWERYIENHYRGYGIGEHVEILLTHKGLGAFLVVGTSTVSASRLSSSKGAVVNTFHHNHNDVSCVNGVSDVTTTRFYLFTEDLSEARLVGGDWEECLHNLRMVPVRYVEGSEVLRAAERSGERDRDGDVEVEAEREKERGDKGMLVRCLKGRHDVGRGREEVGWNGNGNRCGSEGGDARGMDMDMGMGMDID
ncbi:hypothetical protein PAAG_07152 [Paracoccidioides lutzii Pb01]|uniref:Uncharacterized protein n=1 Tax=Paracoccidioides lutzii (strain ATCC MYA-826 / Pb01) TaxID=502779 RepID=C1H8R1_PARBA|nr:hypothetical protein PAAG_07152 [Paracoccidioides lutzii Pb01]EEH36734.1 hypothetical protein PAAG_07152 [Paracoccidioides lutzii Pb01]